MELYADEKQLKLQIMQQKKGFQINGRQFKLSCEDIEDLSQDTFLKSYTNYGQWFNKNGLVSKIFNNLSIDRFCRKKNPIVYHDISECWDLEATPKSRYDDNPFTLDDMAAKIESMSEYGKEICDSIAMFLNLGEPKSPKLIEDREIVLIVWTYLTIRPQIIYKDREKTIKITDLINYCKDEQYYDYCSDYKSLFTARNAIAKLIEAYKDFMRPSPDGTDGTVKNTYCTLCARKKAKPYLYLKLTNQITDYLKANDQVSIKVFPDISKTFYHKIMVKYKRLREHVSLFLSRIVTTTQHKYVELLENSAPDKVEKKIKTMQNVA